MLRSHIIRIAADLPKGDPVRLKLLHLARGPYMDEQEDIQEQQDDQWLFGEPVPDFADLPRKKVVVLNRKHGGFGLSKKAEALLSAIHGGHVGGRDYDSAYHHGKYHRHDPALIWVVEKLGKAANGPAAELGIVPLKSGMYVITEYDGAEGVQVPQDIDWIKF